MSCKRAFMGSMQCTFSGTSIQFSIDGGGLASTRVEAGAPEWTPWTGTDQIMGAMLYSSLPLPVPVHFSDIDIDIVRI